MFMRDIEFWVPFLIMAQFNFGFKGMTDSQNILGNILFNFMETFALNWYLLKDFLPANSIS